jgi:hypothetical protein
MNLAAIFATLNFFITYALTKKLEFYITLSSKGLTGTTL